MIVNLSHGDPLSTDRILEGLQIDLDDAGVTWRLPPAAPSSLPTKGDAVSAAALIIPLLGAGGAAAVAVGPRGFLTVLAGILADYINRGTEIEITDSKGKRVFLKGSSADIKDILSRVQSEEK